MIPPRPAVIAHGKVLRKRTPAPYSVANVLPVCTCRPLGTAIMRVGGSLKMSLTRLVREKISLGDVKTKNYRSHIAMGFEPTIAC